MELNYYEIQVYNERTNDFDIFIVIASDMTGARIEFYKCFRETTHDLYNMITKKLEEI